MIHIWIPGKPRTKGSLDEFHQDTAQSKDWRRRMAYALNAARRGPGYEELIPAGVAVAVRAVFWLPTDDATTPNVGDLDKLARNLLDAGTDSGAYADDVQVVRLFTDKVACAAGEGPGVLVSIWAPSPVELECWRAVAAEQRGRAMAAQGLLS